ncbi:MAG: CAP domain-containing protein [Actinomycetota bacterium]
MLLVSAALFAAGCSIGSSGSGGEVSADDLGIDVAGPDAGVALAVDRDQAIDDLRSAGEESEGGDVAVVRPTTTSTGLAPPSLSADGVAAQPLPRPGAAPAGADGAGESVAVAESTTTTAAPAAPDDSTVTVATSDPAAATSTTVAVSTTASTVAAVTEPELIAGEEQSAALLAALRAEQGLTPLARSPEMDQFARSWSKQMAETGAFEHSSGPYGENIAFTSDTSLTPAAAADLFQQLWRDSPGHYANMTNGSYTVVGVGLYRTERGWYGTHVFNY